MQQSSQNLQIDLVLCECKSLEHQIVLIKFKDDDEVYLQVHLHSSHNFLHRLWHGLKYAFGYKSKYGAWDEFVLGPNELTQIKNFVEK